MNDDFDELLSQATKAQSSSHSPYSRFRVGAALQSDDGKIFTGCNIESSSYGLTICAERVALYKAVSEGVRSFRRMLIVTDAQDFCPPCGACRQVIWDFAKNLEIILVNGERQQKRQNITDLYPEAFGDNFLAGRG
ncbi:MAG: cytidine deaminase [bacterium]